MSVIGHDVEVYPNPNNGDFTINFGEAIEGMRYQMVDQLGRLIQEDNLEDGLRQQKISIRNVEVGIYYLYLIDGAENIIVKKIEIIE